MFLFAFYFKGRKIFSIVIFEIALNKLLILDTDTDTWLMLILIIHAKQLFDGADLDFSFSHKIEEPVEASWNVVERDWSSKVICLHLSFVENFIQITIRAPRWGFSYFNQNQLKLRLWQGRGRAVCRSSKYSIKHWTLREYYICIDIIML